MIKGRSIWLTFRTASNPLPRFNVCESSAESLFESTFGEVRNLRNWPPVSAGRQPIVATSVKTDVATKISTDT
jgi:hypothetical protein